MTAGSKIGWKNWNGDALKPAHKKSSARSSDFLNSWEQPELSFLGGLEGAQTAPREMAGGGCTCLPSLTGIDVPRIVPDLTFTLPQPYGTLTRFSVPTDGHPGVD